MGLFDTLKGRAEKLGEKAKDGLGAAKDKASGLIDDVKGRLDSDPETPADGPVAQAPPTADVGGAAADGAQDRYDEVLRTAQQRADDLQAKPDTI